MTQRERGCLNKRQRAGRAHLAGGLEEKPREQRVPLLVARHGQPLLGVVLVGEVEHDRVGLPHHEVVVVVVDERRDAPVGVVLGVFRGLLLALGEVEEDVLVGEAELFQHERDFAAGAMQENEPVCEQGKNKEERYSPSVEAPDVVVEGELLSVRHCMRLH